MTSESKLSETAFTPGPWWTDAKYDVEEAGCAIIAARTDCGPLPGNPTRGMVAFATQLLPERSVECEANARLIAAAPDMLAALESVVGWFDRTWDESETANRCRRAITAATGGSHGQD